MQLTIETFPKQRPNITLQDLKIFQEALEYEPSNKEIRLAVDLAKQAAPMRMDHEDMVRSILKCNISNNRINAVKSFKKITKKKVIEFVDGKHKTVTVLRKRNVSK